MTGTGETWRLERRPALDGVRGVAILLVLAGHLFFPGVHDEGRAGLAVFFTLSGFLITTLLLQEHADSKRISLRRFFARRIRRLVPAQVFCVAVVSTALLPLGANLLTPGQALRALLYVQNFFPTQGTLAHFWSLAVEEQFYLTWAPLVALVFARRRGTMIVLALAGALSSWWLRTTYWELRAGGLEFGRSLAFQADPILIGCAMAAWMHGRPSRRVPSVVPVVAMVVAGSMATFSTLDLLVWGQVVVAGLTAVALYGAAHGAGDRVLGCGLLAALGRRSYAVYLWHFPLIMLAQPVGLAPFWTATLVVAVSLGLAAVSWRFVEAPFLQRDHAASPGGLPPDRARALDVQVRARTAGPPSNASGDAGVEREPDLGAVPMRDARNVVVVAHETAPRP